MRPLLRTTLTLLLVSMGCIVELAAQGAGAMSKFPVPFGPTNVGREFYFAFPANWYNGETKAFVRLYVTSGKRTKVQLMAGDQPRQEKYTVPNDIITFDLTLEQAQMFSRNPYGPVPDDQVYRNRAVHLLAEAPIVVYGMNRVEFTSDGFLALPVNALGRDYVVASSTDFLTDVQPNLRLPSQFMVTAAYDNTVVTIINSMATMNHPAGVVYTETLNKGDVFSAMSSENGGDLSGTYITATRPVAVTAGQNCAYLPRSQDRACDHICEMLFPISAWGKVYHAVPFLNRTKGDMFRIFAGEENADIYVNNQKIGTINRVGGMKGDGFLEYLPPTRENLEFRSNKPIQVCQYNNSQLYDNSTGTDPFFLTLTPVEQYQTDFTFTTPGADFTNNWCYIVSDSATYKDIEIAPAGTEGWEKLSLKVSQPPQPFVNLVDGRRYVGVAFVINPGEYRLRSPRGIAGYIYGYHIYDSYGYPISAAVANINTPDTLAPLIMKKEQDCFGNVVIDVLDIPEEDTIRANLSSIELIEEASENYEIYDNTKFVSGEDRGTTYRMRVVDKTKDAHAVVAIVDAANNMRLDTVRYFAFSVEVVPPLSDYGALLLGGSGTRRITLTNKSARPVEIKELSLKNGAAHFTIIQPTTGFILGPTGSGTESKEVEIAFKGDVAGTWSDSLGVRDSCGMRYMAAVRAVVGTPRIKVSDINFGQWPVKGGALTKSFTIENTSPDGAELTVSGRASGPTDGATFTLPNGLPAFPLILPAGGRQTVNVGFDPAAAQPYSDAIYFNHNAAPSPENDSVALLTGEGIESNLVGDGWTWTERVMRGPYDKTLSLKNLGTAPIVLTGPPSYNGDQVNFTLLNAGDFPRTLQPNESWPVNVRYDPKTPADTGVRQLEITFASADGDAKIVLEATGVIPRIWADPLDFGTVTLGDPEIGRQVSFRVWLAGAYDDTVVIDRFTFTSDQAGGQDDFRWDQINGPITLIPRQDDSIVINGYFTGRAAGIRNATLVAHLRSYDQGYPELDTISNWTGLVVATDALIAGTGGSVNGICIGNSGELTAEVVNTGDLELTIDGLDITGGSGPNFTVIDPPTPFQLAKGERRTIRIRYTPTATGPVNATLQVQNTSDNNPTLSLNLTGEAGSYTRNASVEVTGTKGTQAEFGREARVAVKLDEAMAPASLYNYTVTLTYDPKLFNAPTDASAITLGPANSGATVAIDPSSTAGRLVVTVNSTTAVNGPGELFSVPFGVTFDARLNRTVDATLTTTDGGAGCLTVNVASGTVAVEGICGLSVRMIERFNAKYALEQNAPNPFNPVTKITYSLGLDAPTKLLLFDASGNLVQTLIDEYQQPGAYEVTLDVTNLPSGLYYYQLHSGEWSKTRTLQVVK